MPIGEIATSLKGAYVEVKWTIHSFFSLSVADGVYYYSPDFSIGGETWYLEIYANGRSGYGTRYYVDLGLWRDSCGPSIRQEFSFSLQSVKGKKENIKHCTKVFENKYPDNKCDFLRFIERSELLRRQNDLVPDGFLTIVYTVNNMTSARSAKAVKEQSTPELNKVDTMDVSVSNKTEGKQTGVTETKESDYNCREKLQLAVATAVIIIAVVITGCVFAYSKMSLSYLHPYEAVKEHKENSENVCTDSSSQTGEGSEACTSRFGDVQMISKQNVFNLFTAADKYEVLDLRAKCWEFMKNNLIVDTFCETITLALQHSETELIDLATDFFLKNAEEILLTVKWHTFVVENPMQSNELFIKFVKSVKHSNA